MPSEKQNDGKVLLDARQSGGKFRRRHLSTDGGITWGPDNPDDVPLTPLDGSPIRHATIYPNEIARLLSGPVR